MAIALAFIIFIGTYVTQERSYDTFVGDDVYVGSDAELFSLSGTVKGAVEGRYPDIEAVCRTVGTMSVNGWDLSVSVGDRTMVQNALCVDSNFLSLIPLPMAVGDRKGLWRLWARLLSRNRLRIHISPGAMRWATALT